MIAGALVVAEHMQIYYRDHPEAGGYLYVAVRAPNDTWNGFYDVYVYPLIATLIGQFKEMYPAVRNPVPRELAWLMTDGVITDFFWLRVEKPSKQQEILASCRDNRFVITANSNVVAATVLFDSRLVDFARPVEVDLNGATTTHTFTPSLKTLVESLLRRGDPELGFTASFEVRRDDPSGRMVVAVK